MGTAGEPARLGEVPSGPQLGELLLKEGLITEAQLQEALRVQKARTAYWPLGRILVERRVITQTQLDIVLDWHQKRCRLGQLLVEAHAISDGQLEIALHQHRATGLRLGDTLVQLGFVSEERLQHGLCAQFGITFVDLDKLVVDESLEPLIDQEYAERHRVVPIARTEGVTTVAVGNPADVAALDELGTTLGRLNVVTSTEASFRRAFARVYGESPEAGLIRRHAELERAHETLSQAHQAASEELREVRERAAQATRSLGELRLAHEALRRAHAACPHGPAAPRESHPELVHDPKTTADEAQGSAPRRLGPLP